MGGHLEVWGQHFTSEGAARNNVGPAEKTTGSVSLRNGLREMLRVTDPKQLPNEGSTPYKLGGLRRSPWTSAHNIPADVAWRSHSHHGKLQQSIAPISQPHTSGQKQRRARAVGYS